MHEINQRTSQAYGTLPFRVLKDGTGELEWPVSSAHNSKTKLSIKL